LNRNHSPLLYYCREEVARAPFVNVDVNATVISACRCRTLTVIVARIPHGGPHNVRVSVHEHEKVTWPSTRTRTREPKTGRPLPDGRHVVALPEDRRTPKGISPLRIDLSVVHLWQRKIYLELCTCVISNYAAACSPTCHGTSFPIAVMSASGAVVSLTKLSLDEVQILGANYRFDL
jgi:hypothetical protein